MASPLWRCCSLLFSALGQLPPLYEATPDYRVITQITSHAIAGPLKKKKKIIHINDSTLSYDMQTNSSLCCLLPLGKSYSQVLKSLEADVLRPQPHREQYVSVNIWTLTPCINIILH